HAGIAAGRVQQDDQRAAIERRWDVGERARPGVQVVHGGAVDLDVLRMQERSVTTSSRGVSIPSGSLDPSPARVSSGSPTRHVALGSPPVRPRDLDTLEFPRALEAIAGLARSEAGRAAVCALHPTSDRAEAERRLDTLAELVALGGEAGSL